MASNRKGASQILILVTLLLTIIGLSWLVESSLRGEKRPHVEVQENDRIFDPMDTLGLSPFVVESHKLIFFPVSRVGVTTWMKLFRRMMGHDDWKTANPHEGDAGLVRLKDLSRLKATEILNSPHYTRVIFVRDPKERFLSTWFQKILQYDLSIQENCCKDNDNCLDEAQTLSGFIDLARNCVDRHWLPQSHVMEAKYWPMLDFVGHAETMADDARRLLKRLGVWDTYGKTGWGENGDEFLFESKAEGMNVKEMLPTSSWNLAAEIYTPETEAAVDDLYADDYEIMQFNLPREKLAFGKKLSSDIVVVKQKDRIYDPFDTLGLSPIVVKRHKIVFFPVPGAGLTTWLKLFRRMEGHMDWKTTNPHVGDGGLVRLKNLGLDQAIEVMNSPEYTRVMFVRDPKERFLSTWFEKIQHYDLSVTMNCCEANENCLDSAQNVSGFVELASHCTDRHWLPQSQAMEAKYWSKLDFVGHSSTMQQHAKQLLIQLGAWDEYGMAGWGKNGKEPLFLDDHLTKRRTSEYFDRFAEILTPETEAEVDNLFRGDYEVTELNLHAKQVDFSRHGYEWKRKLQLPTTDHPVQPISGIHILAYETNSSVFEEPFSTWNSFLAMSKASSIRTTTFGQGTVWNGFGDKYIHARKLLATMDQDVIVILSDARDVLLNVPGGEYAEYALENFVSTFRRLTRNNLDAVVISAEAQCCVSAMCHAGPEEYFDSSGNRNVRACSSGKEDCMYAGNINVHRWKTHMKELAFEMTGRHPESTYLNAGLIAGTPRALIGLIDRLSIEGYEDDQAVMSGLLFHDPLTHILDYDQELFGNTEWVKGLRGGGCTFHVNEDGLLAHNVTAATPLIVHTPGKFFGCLDLLLDSIGGTSPQRYLKAEEEDEKERRLQENYGSDEVLVEEVSAVGASLGSDSVAVGSVSVVQEGGPVPTAAPSISMAPSLSPT